MRTCGVNEEIVEDKQCDVHDWLTLYVLDKDKHFNFNNEKLVLKKIYIMCLILTSRLDHGGRG